MRRIGMAVALFTVFALVGTACGSGGGTEETGGGKLARNATLRMAWVLPAMPFDPHTVTSTVAAHPYLSLVYDRLTQVVTTPDGPKVAPMVATSWKYSDDGEVLTFQLRKDVTFHDGTPLTAEAVKLSLKRAMSLDKSTVADDLSAIARVQAVDDYTVRLHLSHPDVTVPYALATLAGAIINPKALPNNVNLAQNPAGSGPYTLAELQLGHGAVYQRYEDYWDPKAAKVAKIELIAMPSKNARFNAWRSGQVDAIQVYPWNADEIKQVSSSEQYKFHTLPDNSSFVLRLNGDHAPLSKVKVRKALNFAVNRQAINKNLFDGKCSPTSQPLSPGMPGHARLAEDVYSYNPTKAKRLLNQAGVGNGFQMSMLVGTDSPYKEIGVALQNQLGRIGVDVTIRSLEIVRADQDFRKGKSDSFVNHISGYTSPVWLLNQAYHNAPWTLPDDYQTLVDQASKTIDASARKKLLQQASATASQQALSLFICTNATAIAAESNVVGLDNTVAPQTGAFSLRYVGVTNK